MAQPAVIRPTVALDTTIEFRFDPASAVRARRHRPRPLPWGQPFFQFDGLGSREAPGYLARVAQAFLTYGGNAKSLDAAPSCLITDDNAGHDPGRHDPPPA